MNPRANAYIFSEYNLFENSKNPMQIKLGAIKRYQDVLTGCKESTDGTVVSSKSTKVSSDCKYANFDTDSSVSYIPSGKYLLHTDTSKLKSIFETDGGTMDDTTIGFGNLEIADAPAEITSKATTTTTTSTTITTVTVTTTTTLPSVNFSIVCGDVDGNGEVKMNDAVLIMLYIANPDEYPLVGQALINADCSGNGDGVTNKEALAIQKYLAKMLTSLPEV